MFNKKEEKKGEFEDLRYSALMSALASQLGLFAPNNDMVLKAIHALKSEAKQNHKNEDLLRDCEGENRRLQSRLKQEKKLIDYTDEELEEEQEKRHLAKMIQAHLKPGVQFSLMDTEYVITEVSGNYCYCWYPGSESIQLGCEVVLRAMNLI